MKYYFYNEVGEVTLIYYVMPPREQMLKKYIATNKEFEDKEGFSKKLTVDLGTLELNCEYIKKPPTIEEEVKTLKEELSITQNALDFLLINGSSNEVVKTLFKDDELNLSTYLSMRISSGKLDYDTVISKYSNLKCMIDSILNL